MRHMTTALVTKKWKGRLETTSLESCYSRKKPKQKTRCPCMSNDLLLLIVNLNSRRKFSSIFLQDVHNSSCWGAKYACFGDRSLSNTVRRSWTCFPLQKHWDRDPSDLLNKIVENQPILQHTNRMTEWKDIAYKLPKHLLHVEIYHGEWLMQDERGHRILKNRHG